MRRPGTLPLTKPHPLVSGIPRLRAGNLALGICLFLALVLSFAVPAKSALVSGRVYDQNGALVRNTTFTVQNSNRQPVPGKDFQTDRSGTYGVYLEPGEYFVRAKENDSKGEGVIKSYPQPVHQDIYLRAQ